MKKVCSISGCGSYVTFWGFCSAHAQRARTHGDPLAGRVSPGTLQKWIDEHRDYDGDDCLIWPFARMGRGYGQIMISRKATYVHRIMCEHRNGPPPSPKHEAAHSCGKGHEGCVNPNHLSWKTRLENRADMIAHGTRLVGQQCGSAKLTDFQAEEIKRGSLDSKTTAAIYNISASHVRNIRSGFRRVALRGIP